MANTQESNTLKSIKSVADNMGSDIYLKGSKQSSQADSQR